MSDDRIIHVEKFEVSEAVQSGLTVHVASIPASPPDLAAVCLAETVQLRSLLTKYLDHVRYLEAKIDRLTPLADAAAVWAAAVAEPNGVYDADKALQAAVKVWQQGSSDG